MAKAKREFSDTRKPITGDKKSIFVVIYFVNTLLNAYVITYT